MSRLRDALRPPRKLTFTGEGRWFVAMTLMVGTGAINTGNNLLYLLLGMLLGLILVSGVLSERVIDKISIRRLESGDLFAGTTSRIAFEISNAKRWIPSYSITVQEHESRPTRAMRRVAIGLPEKPPRKKKLRLAEADPGGPKALALRIPPRQSVVATAEVMFPRRGLYAYVGLDLATRFPFGFFEKTKPIREPRELIVYPSIRADLLSDSGGDTREGEVEQREEGRQGEFFGLREYRTGDDLRDIHWKATARRGALIRRTYDRRDNESVAVHLFDWLPPNMPPSREKARLEAMEEAISVAATVCADLAARGHRFSLHTTTQVVTDGAGAAQLQSALRTLALVTIRRDAQPPSLPLSLGDNRLLVVTPELPDGVRDLFDSRVTARAATPAAPLNVPRSAA